MGLNFNGEYLQRLIRLLDTMRQVREVHQRASENHTLNGAPPSPKSHLGNGEITNFWKAHVYKQIHSILVCVFFGIPPNTAPVFLLVSPFKKSQTRGYQQKERERERERETERETPMSWFPFKPQTRGYPSCRRHPCPLGFPRKRPTDRRRPNRPPAPSAARAEARRLDLAEGGEQLLRRLAEANRWAAPNQKIKSAFDFRP